MQQFYGGGAERQERVQKELQANRYDPAADTLTWTRRPGPGLRGAHRPLRGGDPQPPAQRRGHGAGSRSRPRRRSASITAFIAWTAWTASARRPGRPYSYTNNWPPEPLVGNQLTEEAVVWSTLSIIALLGGIGLMLAAFGRYSHLLGWHGAEERRLRFLPPGGGAADPGPAVHGLVLLRGRRPVPGADAAGRGDGPLPRRDRQLLRPRPAQLAPLQPDPHLAPATGHLLRGHRLPGRRHLPGPADRRPRAARPAAPVLPAAGGAGRWSWSAAWPARRPATRAGSRTTPSRSSALRAGSTSTWAGSGRSSWWSAWSCGAPSSTAACAASWPARAGATCRTCSSTAPCRSRCSTPWAWSTGRTPTSPSPTSGASGSSTCGSRTSWSCSPPSWWPTSSSCWAWCRRRRPRGSSTSTPCCTRWAASSAPCTTCTSAARRPSTWPWGPSSRRRR